MMLRLFSLLSIVSSQYRCKDVILTDAYISKIILTIVGYSLTLRMRSASGY